jgi:6-phosphogluconolactonase
MGFSALNRAREAWLLVSGAEKAPMTAMALGGAGPVQVPAAGVRGRQQTLWLLDEDAAARLPRELFRR